MGKKGILFILSILMLCFTAGACSSKGGDAAKESGQPETEPKEFTADGAKITLASNFTETKQDKYTFQYSSPNVLCIGQKELKSDIAAAGITVESLSDYAKTVMQSVGIDSSYAEHGQSLYFEWDKDINDTGYSYIGFVTETGDAYWLVQFAALKDEYSELRDGFFDYYDSFSAS